MGVFILQDLDFMTYQVRRTTITTFVHLCLPLVYCIGMSMVEPQIYAVSVLYQYLLKSVH